jgi:hypothetical protein
MQDILPDTKNALILKANHLQNSFVENKGQGRFELKPLPSVAQMAPLYGMVTEDINADGNLDLIASGNDFGNEIVNGHYDAMNGIVLLGDGLGGFTTPNIAESGIFIPGDGKGLARIGAGSSYAIAATQNKDVLKLFGLKMTHQIVRLNKDDKKATIYLQNGKQRVLETYYGDSFLSQSARILLMNNSMQRIEVTNSKGTTRTFVPGIEERKKTVK